MPLGCEPHRAQGEAHRASVSAEAAISVRVNRRSESPPQPDGLWAKRGRGALLSYECAPAASSRSAFLKALTSAPSSFAAIFCAAASAAFSLAAFSVASEISGRRVPGTGECLPDLSEPAARDFVPLATCPRRLAGGFSAVWASSASAAFREASCFFLSSASSAASFLFASASLFLAAASSAVSSLLESTPGVSSPFSDATLVCPRPVEELPQPQTPTSPVAAKRQASATCSALRRLIGSPVGRRACPKRNRGSFPVRSPGRAH
jgi:hypothetical protein